MRNTLEALNALEAAGVIRRYAIGRAAAAIFYMEPLLTFDLGVFISLPAAHSGITSLASIHQATSRLGFAEDEEHVIIERVPAQFLPVYNLLLQEALDEAQETLCESIATCVFRPEHLIAIMLQTARDA